MSKVFSIFIVAAVMVSFIFIGSPVFAAPLSEPGAMSAPTAVQAQAGDPADRGPDLTYGLVDYSMFFIPAAAFTPRWSSTAYGYSGAGYIYSRGASDDFDSFFWAPLVLPPGALLHGIRLFYYDNSASDISLYVTRFRGETTPITTDLASWTSTGTPGYASEYMSVGETIRYEDPATAQEQGYVVYVRLRDATANQMFKGVRVLYYLQLSPAPATASFSDVPTTHPFFQYVEALYGSGITTGYGDGRFGPDDVVTRGQMAAFLARALGLHWQK